MSTFDLFESNLTCNVPVSFFHYCCPSNVKQTSKGDIEKKGMLNFSFIDWGSLDQTCEMKHAGWNLMLIENGLLSLLIKDSKPFPTVINSGYTNS